MSFILNIPVGIIAFLVLLAQFDLVFGLFYILVFSLLWLARKVIANFICAGIINSDDNPKDKLDDSVKNSIANIVATAIFSIGAVIPAAWWLFVIIMSDKFFELSLDLCGDYGILQWLFAAAVVIITVAAVVVTVIKLAKFANPWKTAIALIVIQRGISTWYFGYGFWGFLGGTLQLAVLVLLPCLVILVFQKLQCWLKSKRRSFP